jgi:hypothetical protein
MKQSIVRLAFPIALAACAGRQAPQTSSTAKADLDAAFTCATSAIQGGGYRVSKDDRRLAVRGFIREDGVAEPTTLAGTVVGDPSVGDFRVAYEVDGIDAAVSLDGRGKVKISAEAYTGVGGSSKSGYTKRPASARGASTVKRVEGCAA